MPYHQYDDRPSRCDRCNVPEDVIAERAAEVRARWDLLTYGIRHTQGFERSADHIEMIRRVEAGEIEADFLATHFEPVRY